MNLRILILFLIVLMFIPTAESITISTTNTYHVVERTHSDTVTITSNDGGATTHWIMNGVDMGTNVLSQAITYNVERYNNLTIYQTNGATTSNVLYFTIIVTPLLDISPMTRLDDNMSTNLTTAIGNSDFVEIMTVPRDYYVNILGLVFYVLVWGIYAGMLYIRQNTWHIPAILGIIFSVIILSQMPNYAGLIELGIIAGFFAVVYTFFKSRR